MKKFMKMVTLITLLLLLLLVIPGNCQNKTTTVQCPFRLSCSPQTNQIIEFPTPTHPARFLVTQLDCESKTLYLSESENCLSTLFLTHNFSLFYPLETRYSDSFNITFFNCSGQHSLKNWPQRNSGAQDMLSCPIFVADPSESVIELDLVRCKKLVHRVLPTYASSLRDNGVQLSWSETNFDNGCLDYEHKPKKKKLTSTIVVATTVIVGSTMLAIFVGVLFRLYLYYRMKGEDQTRLDNFLKDYSASKPTRFSYADIKRITDKFKETLGEGAHGTVYKGKLSNQITVAVKILNNTEGDGREFINEVGTMGKIHHLNVLRLLGFCADRFYRALVYDFFPNGSLQKFISPPNNKDVFLGWDKLQQIASGIAYGIEYLHQGCDQRILHFDINPNNILLDDSLTPKISDFGLAKLCSKNQSVVSMTAARGTIGYMAPEVFSRNFGNVSYKSDIYSYGMLLLEMVGGRKNTNTTMGEENLQVLYPDWIHNMLEGRDIQIPIDDEGDLSIVKKLAIVGLWCIQWNPMHRPSMKAVVQMLQGDGEKLEVPHNPFEPTSSNDMLIKRPTLELEVIQELN